MSVFQKTKKKKNQFIGAWIPQKIHTHLALYQLAEDVSKSELIRKALEDWTRKITGIEELLEVIKTRAQQQWKIEKIMNPTTNINLYKKNLAEVLHNIGIEESYINKISDSIHDPIE